MTQQDVLTLEKAMEAASESISSLKRFIESLDKFLKANDLGSAEYSADYSAVEFRCGDHGYDTAMVHVWDRNSELVIYFYVYTDGTVVGGNFSEAFRLNSGINHRCTYLEAAREILKTIGILALTHSPSVSQKINKAIEALR
jgi:hypothetical protein